MVGINWKGVAVYNGGDNWMYNGGNELRNCGSPQWWGLIASTMVGIN